MHLYQVLANKVAEWRSSGYQNDQYSVIAEILEWAREPEGSGFRLREPQLRALETYWYLRLVEKTPHIVDLYRRCFPSVAELLTAVGLDKDEMKNYVIDHSVEELFQRVGTDDAFVKKHKLEALRETLSLDYPSYILALAMGSGKTILIGSIIAAEFAMSLEYPDGPFIQNALVFAPGKTIIESLRELAEVNYNRILPTRLSNQFAASVKLTFTRDGDKDIPVIYGSYFNLIVTNTEKIRITSEKILKGALGPLFSPLQEEEARKEVANARLRTISSLPHLGIFSDEAHHTYGQPMDSSLKKVRQTVNYLAEKTNVVCVVNTTGTPYFQKQPLRDVVIWYGLSEGIRDNILKQVSGNIQAFDFEGNVEAYLDHVVKDFFDEYGEIALPDGTPAKLAIFFPQTNDVAKYRPMIEKSMAKYGHPVTWILEHHTANDNKEDFDRFKTKNSAHRVALLVNRGVEGWDVPALFACALARRLRSSANFVLQAASRCLRQVPGNSHDARIYLSAENRGILDKQLQETYGETITELNLATRRQLSDKIVLRKLDIPPLVVKQLIRTVALKEKASQALKLVKPEVREGEMKKYTFALAEQRSTYHILQQIEETEEIMVESVTIDLYSAAVELSTLYRTNIWDLYDQLREIANGAGEIPTTYLGPLAEQIEGQIREYEVTEEIRERALALVKLNGFDIERDAAGAEIYTAEIRYLPEKEKLLARWMDWATRAEAFGFHYDPYNFHSQPEKNFFEQMLQLLNKNKDNIQDIYFTGKITDPQKTDFYVEYKNEDGSWHRYTPDFIIRCKNGKCLIVEIKAEKERGNEIDGEHGRKTMALRKWEELNPDLLKYEMIFTDSDIIPYDHMATSSDFVEGC